MGSFITLAQGAGGKETQELLKRLFFSPLPEMLKRTPEGLGIDRPDDAAAIRVGDGYIVITIDSYTVSPSVFPGGDIGGLAASGTINDVLMLGGTPIAALDSLIVEEGLQRTTLEQMIGSMLKVFAAHNIPLIGGDLKVMPKGEVDGLVITTAALGKAERLIIDQELMVGDKIIVSGTVAEHGATILAMQHSLSPSDADLRSDARPLTDLMLPLTAKFGDKIHAARDPTRGGLAMLLNDWAEGSGNTIIIDEGSIPVRDPVKKYTEMLGVNWLNLASEGVSVLGVDGNSSDIICEFIRSLGYTKASVVGEVKESEDHGAVAIIRTLVGGLRILIRPSGEIVPRIC